MNALHLKSFCGSFASLVHRLHTLFMQEVAVVSKSIVESGCKALIELRRDISECAAAVKGRLGRLVGGDLVFFETSATVLEAGETGGAREVGPSK